MRKFLSMFVLMGMISTLAGCAAQTAAESTQTLEMETATASAVQENSAMQDDTEVIAENTEEKTDSMKLYINEEEVPVRWENCTAVSELMEEAEKSDIIVEMSMYSTNEQVGSLGTDYTADDENMTTSNGDIVLYNSSNIVVFYAPNTWSYTKLGKIELPEENVRQLLSNGNVRLRLKFK